MADALRTPDAPAGYELVFEFGSEVDALAFRDALCAIARLASKNPFWMVCGEMAVKVLSSAPIRPHWRRQR